MFTGKTKTPGKAPKTPSGGDRFIPSRSSSQYDLGHFKIMTSSTEDPELLSPSQKEFQKVMSENLNGTDVAAGKVLSYQAKAPSAPAGNAFFCQKDFHKFLICKHAFGLGSRATVLIYKL